MKKSFCSLFILSLIFSFIIPAHAQVIYATPPTVYYQPSPSYQMGQAIGNIIGSIIASSNQKAQEQKMLQIRENIRNQIQDTVTHEADTIAKVLNEMGVEATFKAMNDLLYQQGHRYNSNLVNGVLFLSYSFKPTPDPNCPDLFYEYSINTNEKKCRVIASIPALNIQEMGLADYVDPVPELTETQAIGQYLGLTTNDVATMVNGHACFSVLEVAPNGLAALAGVHPNDLIVKIDDQEITDGLKIERVASYIAGRMQKKSLVKVVLLRQGKQETAQIQLGSDATSY